jgi:hypothetical protein
MSTRERVESVVKALPSIVSPPDRILFINGSLFNRSVVHRIACQISN